jgi:alpha-tubulin suppressor-like RCC1 family protein
VQVVVLTAAASARRDSTVLAGAVPVVVEPLPAAAIRGSRGMRPALLTMVLGLAGCSWSTPPAPGFVEIAANDSHACGRTAQGQVWCWGRSSAGQLGEQPRRRFLALLDLPVSRPVLVGGLGRVSQLSLGLSSSCALLADGTVRCWGRGACDEDGEYRCSTPTAVAGLTDAVQIAGATMGCAVHRTGRVSCWNLLDARSTLTPVPDLDRVVEVAASDRARCARTDDGSVRCWGATDHGRLGDGSSTSANNRPNAPEQATPTRVAALPPATQIRVGSHSSCALSNDGGVLCWGNNERGSLGNGRFGGEQPLPAPVVGISDAVEIAIESHGCARLRDGTVRCWGWNAFGQLGDGAPSDTRLTPVAVHGLTGALEIEVGLGFSCARTAAGVFCWGRNNNGQLGDGTSADRSRLGPMVR